MDDGEYAVTLEQNGKDVEILRYTTQGGANPCFGELALMYSKPRAATVTAVTDGVLWAMDRRSFRSILMKSSAVTLTKTLRSVEVLKSLSVGQLQRLQDLLTECTYKDGEYVIKQGEQSENLCVPHLHRQCRHVACPPHPTSRGDTCNALLTLLPLLPRGMPSSAYTPW